MNSSVDNRLEGLIALLTELKYPTKPIAAHASPVDDPTIYAPKDDEIWGNYLATICVEAWQEKVALTWMQSATHVDLYIASSLPITDHLKDHLQNLWGIICQARTQYKADPDSEMSGWIDQVKEQVFPRLSKFLGECKISLDVYLRLLYSDTFVNDAIKAINGVRFKIFSIMSAVMKGMKEILSLKGISKKIFGPLDGLINHFFSLNAAMKGFVELFVKLSESECLDSDTLEVTFLDPELQNITLPSESDDWLGILPPPLRCTWEAFESAIKNLGSGRPCKVGVHPALVLYTTVRSLKLAGKYADWNIGSSSTICRACAEYIEMDSYHYSGSGCRCPHFQRNTDRVSFAYPWAFPEKCKIPREDFFKRISNIVRGGIYIYTDDPVEDCDDMDVLSEVDEDSHSSTPDALADHGAIRNSEGDSTANENEWHYTLED